MKETKDRVKVSVRMGQKVYFYRGPVLNETEIDITIEDRVEGVITISKQDIITKTKISGDKDVI